MPSILGKSSDSPKDPQHAVDKITMVRRRPSAISHLAGQEVLDPRPLACCHFVTLRPARLLGRPHMAYSLSPLLLVSVASP